MQAGARSKEDAERVKLHYNLRSQVKTVKSLHSMLHRPWDCSFAIGWSFLIYYSAWMLFKIHVCNMGKYQKQARLSVVCSWHSSFYSFGVKQRRWCQEPDKASFSHLSGNYNGKSLTLGLIKYNYPPLNLPFLLFTKVTKMPCFSWQLNRPTN